MRSHILLRGTALAGAAALMLAGCSPSTPSNEPSGSASSSGGAVDGEITLTVATFNEFGYNDLLAEYSELNPGIKVVEKKAATSDEARENFMTKLAAGSGLSDIEGVEVDWLPEIMQSADLLYDLTDSSVADRWLDWKSAQATTADGKLVGYGTDIGPEAVCYRSDLFKAAGLPTDREEVATLLGSTWEDYFAVGKTFVATSDAAWFDSADAIFQGMVNQMENPFSSTQPEETLIPLDENTAIRATYDQLLAASVDDQLSAGLQQWTPDWQNAFQNKEEKGSFATMLCPGWMLGVIEGNAAGMEGWDIANQFPGGGGNWGGSFLTVPAQGKNVEEAKKLAAWLTAPEQQIKAFKLKGTFPSQVTALESEDLLSVTNPFFNDAPTGQILADRAKAVTVNPFKGPNYFAYRAAISQAINRVDVDKTDSPADSWATAASDISALG
ncbi:ABC transporter substrate-binding protein [Tessaracoccus caeni]|uniref:ABC transporter substrate-binding protein n=1 Tax=Tessaracoccus caeni TaxID=3031239 RepID=UPI0023DC7D1B|nr:extracellular solute-binding protein [Tessaracoccus caeni]MDF1489147.1 extracellular solute-binding protein [Tessaracoccus caeni]